MSNAPPRYAPDRDLPPYAFLPGRDPHPTRDPQGHSYARTAEPPVTYATAEDWRANGEYLFGVDLYNHGFLWEAHEAWEGTWIASKADAVQAEHLQGLIQCAAAALKVRMQQPRGLAQLTLLGTGRLEQVLTTAGARYMGLDLAEFVEDFRAFAASEPKSAEGRPRIELRP
ncbi:MAG: DUF309 domain-containing protein [Planctomycetota bacterium]